MAAYTVMGLTLRLAGEAFEAFGHEYNNVYKQLEALGRPLAANARREANIS